MKPNTKIIFKLRKTFVKTLRNNKNIINEILKYKYEK